MVSLFNTQSDLDILLPLIKGYKILSLNSDIQGSLKKFPLFFRQPKMVFTVIRLFDHFTLESIPPVNGIGIVAFIKHLHVWVTKLKPLLMFFKLPILTSNNVIWVKFSAIFFDETQHVVKTSTTGYVPVCYEITNLFIEPQNFLLMFFICKFKGLYLIVTVCDGLLMLSLDLFNSCIKPTW